MVSVLWGQGDIVDLLCNTFTSCLCPFRHWHGNRTSTEGLVNEPSTIFIRCPHFIKCQLFLKFKFACFKCSYIYRNDLHVEKELPVNNNAERCVVFKLINVSVDSEILSLNRQKEILHTGSVTGIPFL